MGYSPIQQYKEQAIRSMTSGELLVLLYDEAIKNLNVALLLLEKNDEENYINCLKKSKDIFYYLSNICNPKYELSSDLIAMYQFINTELMSAEINKDRKYIDEILPIIKDMRETWNEANKITTKSST